MSEILGKEVRLGDATLSLKRDAFDTEQLGMQTWSVVDVKQEKEGYSPNTKAKDVCAILTDTLDAVTIPLFLKASCATNDYAKINALVQIGFKIYGMKITLAYKLQMPPKEVAPKDDNVIMRAYDSKMDNVEDFVRIFEGGSTYTAFNQNPSLNKKKVRTLYDMWVRNNFAGRAKTIFVAVDKTTNEALGFICCKQTDESDTITIDLIHVSRAARGKGIGSALTSKALQHAAKNNACKVHVTTELANLASIGLYSSSGFRVINTGVDLHLDVTDVADKQQGVEQ